MRKAYAAIQDGRDRFRPLRRNRDMRRALLAAVLLAVVFSPAAAPAAKNDVLRANGLTVAAPRGWHITRERLTECSSPTQVMAVTNTHGRLGLNAKRPRGGTPSAQWRYSTRSKSASSGLRGRVPRPRPSRAPRR